MGVARSPDPGSMLAHRITWNRHDVPHSHTESMLYWYLVYGLQTTSMSDVHLSDESCSNSSRGKGLSVR